MFWAGLICLPVLTVIGTLLASVPRFDADIWTHLARYWLPEVGLNTSLLMLGVGLGTVVIGTSLAALVALAEFPGRKWLSVALLLPMAMPGYVLATVIIGQLDYAGPLATQLRDWGVVLPGIRTLGGLIVTLTLTLYPYVYLVTRGAFASQGTRTMEAARLLGLSPAAAFWRVALPQAQPWMLGGMLLVLMETLADFGTASAFGVTTFTTAIYRAWQALFSIEVALQLALLLLLAVMLLVGLERGARRRRRFDAASGPATRLALGRWRWAATAYCLAVLALGFGLPVLQLLGWAIEAPIDWGHLGTLGGRSLLLAVAAAGATVGLALLLALLARMNRGRGIAVAQTVATLGYALPGPLLALGLFVPLAGLASVLNRWLGVSWMIEGGLLLLTLAYATRFLAVAHTPLQAQLLRVPASADDAARLMGLTPTRRLRWLYLPPLATALGAAALLVFVDVMKEMPITLMMRPFGWNTLAVRVFEFTREGMWTLAAAPSLAIVAVGLLPVSLLAWTLQRKPHVA